MGLEKPVRGEGKREGKDGIFLSARGIEKKLQLKEGGKAGFGWTMISLSAERKNRRGWILFDRVEEKVYRKKRKLSSAEPPFQSPRVEKKKEWEQR